jgi:hypothetical protein
MNFRRFGTVKLQYLVTNRVLRVRIWQPKTKKEARIMGLFDKKSNEPSAAIAKMRSLVAQIFSGDEFVETEPGHWAGRQESTYVTMFINDAFGSPEDPILSVTGVAIVDTNDDDKLYRFLITESDASIFSKWEIVTSEVPGKVTVLAVRNLRVSEITKDELMLTLFGIAETADNNDDIIQQRFGGKRAKEHFGWTD